MGTSYTTPRCSHARRPLICVLILALSVNSLVTTKEGPNPNDLILYFYSPPRSPKPQLEHNRGTLFVIVLDAKQIVIASDSRVTTSGGSVLKHEDSVEKVVQLDRNLVFLSTGVSHIYDRDGKTTIKLDEIALKTFKAQRSPDMVLLANLLGRELDRELSKLPQTDVVNLYRVSTELGQENLFQATFAGKDKDGRLKLVTVTFRFFTQTERNRIDGQLKWRVDPPDVGTTEQIVFFLGQSQALRAAFDDPKSPIGQLPFFQKWLTSYKQNKALDAILTAEALVDLGIRYLSKEQRRGVGYPIFVYKIDGKNGFSKVKTVHEGKVASLPH